MKSKQWCKDLLLLIDYIEKNNDIPYQHSDFMRGFLRLLRVCCCLPCYIWSFLGQCLCRCTHISGACIDVSNDLIDKKYILPVLPLPENDDDIKMTLEVIEKLQKSLNKNNLLKSYLLIQSTIPSIQKYAYHDLDQMDYNQTTIFRSKDIIAIAIAKLQQQNKYV